ncbi:MAG: AI-2E family transporter [Myxococcaceae bacterium]
MERVIAKPEKEQAAQKSAEPSVEAPKLAVVTHESHAQGSLPEDVARRIDFIWAGAMVGGLGVVFLLLSLSHGVAVTVSLSLASAYVLNGPVTWLAKKGWSRTLATASVFFALTLLMTGVVLYLIPVFRDEAAKLPDFFRTAGATLVPHIESALKISIPQFVGQRVAELGDEASQIAQSAGPTAARIAAALASNTARLVATILGLLVVPVLTFFFLQDYPKLVERFRGLLPRRSVSLVSKRFAEVDDVLSAFVRGQLTVGAILAVIYSTGLSIARIDMAIVIGAIAGFGNMVPYLGTGIGAVLTALCLMLAWQGPWQIAVAVGTFVVAQAAEGLFITPRIVGNKVGLPPVAVIIAVLAFGELFGFVGILLAVPTSAVLKVVLRVVIGRYRKTALYTGEKPAS